MSRRRAAMLVLVLVSLTLAVVLITPLATLSSVTAVESAYDSATLRHQMAVESVVALLPELLVDTRRQTQLNRDNRVYVGFNMAELQVEILIQDDTAKLPVPILGLSAEDRTLAAALQVLQVGIGLPALTLAGDPLLSTGCLDDLFNKPNDIALFGTPQSRSVWTHYLTPLGDRVHVLRCHPAVLEAALRDIVPGLSTQLAHQIRQQIKPDVAELLEAVELPDQARRLVAQRLTTSSERYSLLIRTTLGTDVRQRYLICDTADPPNILADWEVAP